MHFTGIKKNRPSKSCGISKGSEKGVSGSLAKQHAPRLHFCTYSTLPKCFKKFKCVTHYTIIYKQWNVSRKEFKVHQVNAESFITLDRFTIRRERMSAKKVVAKLVFSFQDTYPEVSVGSTGELSPKSVRDPNL